MKLTASRKRNDWYVNATLIDGDFYISKDQIERLDSFVGTSNCGIDFILPLVGSEDLSPVGERSFVMHTDAPIAYLIAPSVLQGGEILYKLPKSDAGDGWNWSEFKE